MTTVLPRGSSEMQAGAMAGAAPAAWPLVSVAAPHGGGAGAADAAAAATAQRRRLALQRLAAARSRRPLLLLTTSDGGPPPEAALAGALSCALPASPGPSSRLPGPNPRPSPQPSPPTASTAAFGSPYGCSPYRGPSPSTVPPPGRLRQPFVAAAPGSAAPASAGLFSAQAPAAATPGAGTPAGALLATAAERRARAEDLLEDWRRRKAAREGVVGPSGRPFVPPARPNQAASPRPHAAAQTYAPQQSPVTGRASGGRGASLLSPMRGVSFPSPATTGAQQGQVAGGPSPTPAAAWAWPSPPPPPTEQPALPRAAADNAEADARAEASPARPPWEFDPARDSFEALLARGSPRPAAPPDASTPGIAASSATNLPAPPVVAEAAARQGLALASPARVSSGAQTSPPAAPPAVTGEPSSPARVTPAARRPPACERQTAAEEDAGSRDERLFRSLLRPAPSGRPASAGSGSAPSGEAARPSAGGHLSEQVSSTPPAVSESPRPVSLAVLLRSGGKLGPMAPPPPAPLALPPHPAPAARFSPAYAAAWELPLPPASARAATGPEASRERGFMFTSGGQSPRSPPPPVRSLRESLGITPRRTLAQPLGAAPAAVARSPWAGGC